MPSDAPPPVSPAEERTSFFQRLRELIHLKWFLASVWFSSASLLALVVPWGLAKVVDTGIAQSNWQSMIFWLITAALAQIISGLLRYVGTCQISRLKQALRNSQISRLFRRIMYADLRALPDHARGKAMGQILFASDTKCFFMDFLYTQGAALFTTGIGTVTALVYLSWQTAVLSLIVCPFAALLWLWIKKKIRLAARAEYEAQESLFQEFTSIFTSLTSIRALHREAQFTRRFEATTAHSSQTDYILQKKLAIQGPFFDILQALVLIAVFGYGGYLVMYDAMTIGAILAFQVYFARLFGIMKSSTGIFSAWQEYVEGQARAHDIEHLPQAQTIQFDASKSPELLRITDLSFSFDSHPVWQNENLVVHEGDKKAILLPSGAGKTTLARCILGLYPTETGSIAIPDGDVQNIGFVPQENVLFDGSIRDNITLLGNPASDEDYGEVLYLCGLEEVSSRFGDGSIGEQGSRLSGGEQRRVMLARALISAPRLLIIDQMASELEPDLCQQIFERIHEKYPSMGILYLGHRMPEW